MKLSHQRIRTPLGILVAVQTSRGLCDLDFENRWKTKLARLEKRFGNVEFERNSDPHDVAGSLASYFAGELSALDEVPVDVAGSAFERRVWTGLRRIPAGSTVSYGVLAKRVGNPGASRAVGSANGRNPVAIVVPCHRVIRGDGSLGGYAGGLSRKKKLLAHEGIAGVAKLR